MENKICFSNNVDKKKGDSIVSIDRILQVVNCSLPDNINKLSDIKDFILICIKNSIYFEDILEYINYKYDKCYESWQLRNALYSYNIKSCKPPFVNFRDYTKYQKEIIQYTNKHQKYKTKRKPKNCTTKNIRHQDIIIKYKGIEYILCYSCNPPMLDKYKYEIFEEYNNTQSVCGVVLMLQTKYHIFVTVSKLKLYMDKMFKKSINKIYYKSNKCSYKDLKNSNDYQILLYILKYHIKTMGGMVDYRDETNRDTNYSLEHTNIQFELFNNTTKTFDTVLIPNINECKDVVEENKEVTHTDETDISENDITETMIRAYLVYNYEDNIKYMNYLQNNPDRLKVLQYKLLVNK